MVRPTTFRFCDTRLIFISLIAYFVVFFKKGFTPTDLRHAQKNGCKLA